MKSAPRKGGPFALGEHFFWTLVIGVFCLVLVVVFAYVAQSNEGDRPVEPVSPGLSSTPPPPPPTGVAATPAGS